MAIKKSKSTLPYEQAEMIPAEEISECKANFGLHSREAVFLIYSSSSNKLLIFVNLYCQVHAYTKLFQ